MATILQRIVLHQNSKLLTTPSPKVWVSAFPGVDENGKLASTIIKYGKMAIIL